jgi:hypothetical protein
VEYSIHKSHVLGQLTGLGQLSWKAYHFQLHSIEDIFDNQVCGWNQDYDKIKPIFANDAFGRASRSVIRQCRSYIYRDNTKTKHGTIHTGQQFLSLLEFGERKGMPIVYTYVITEEGLFFSESGPTIWKDQLSKHMMHSNVQDSVVYAGEFFINMEIINDKPFYTLYMDNDSGTYAPTSTRLHLLKTLMQCNFVGLPVEAADFHDNQAKLQLKRRLPASKGIDWGKVFPCCSN